MSILSEREKLNGENYDNVKKVDEINFNISGDDFSVSIFHTYCSNSNGTYSKKMCETTRQI